MKSKCTHYGNVTNRRYCHLQKKEAFCPTIHIYKRVHLQQSIMSPDFGTIYQTGTDGKSGKQGRLRTKRTGRTQVQGAAVLPFAI